MKTIVDGWADSETVRVRVFQGDTFIIPDVLEVTDDHLVDCSSEVRDAVEALDAKDLSCSYEVASSSIVSDDHEDPGTSAVFYEDDASGPSNLSDGCDLPDIPEVSDAREVNRYMLGLLRASAVLTPVALLLSWHFELRAAGLTGRLAELYAAHGANNPDWSYLTTLEQTARDAGASALAWTGILNLSAGALVATVAHRLVRASSVPTPAEFFRGVRAKLRRRWRIHQLLAARHRAEVATGTFMMAILLTIFAIAFAYIGMQLSTAYGLRFIEPALYFIGWLFFIAANVLAGRATSLASRVAATWGFGDVLRFITAATMFGIETLISLAIFMFSAALLVD